MVLSNYTRHWQKRKNFAGHSATIACESFESVFWRKAMKAKVMTKGIVAIVLAVLAQTAASGARSGVTAPPDSFFEKVRERDRQAARQFYRKYIDVKGLPVAAAAEVSNLALQRTYEIVTHMLAGRPDILEAMVDRGMYLVIIGADQVYTDLPANRNGLK